MRMPRLPALGIVLLPGVLLAQGDPAFGTRVDSVFSRWNRDTPGCAVGVARNGATLLTRGYGMANLEYGVPLGADAVLESGSVAKQFTSAALALLQLEGRLSLDDDVRRYLPEVPAFGGQVITIRHLLTHTSGLRDQWGLLSLMGSPPTTQVHTLPLILHLVSRQRDLNFPVGSEYLYSNTGYALAAVIVQRVSGQSLAEFSRERFFKPMGMTRTQWRDDYKRIVPGRATAYERRPAGGYAQLMPFTNVYGNGGLLTTVGDMLRWNQALSDGTITGGRPLVNLIETRQRLTGGQTIGYALGLSHSTWQGHRQVAHSGSTAGYQTYLTRFPDDGVSIAVFCNASDANPTRAALQVAGLLLPNQERQASGPVAPVDTAANRAVAGRYRNVASDEILDVLSRPEGLTVRLGAGAVATPLGDQRYRVGNGTLLEFSGQPGARRVRVTTDDGVASTLEELAPPDTASMRQADYAGEYESPELGVRYTVAVDGGRLVVRFPPEPEIRLVPLYTEGFMAGGGRTVRFVRDGSGRVVGFLVFAGRVRGLRFERVPGG
jgi:CubicO group peptidase (beta-lactamase class C family)